MNNPIIFTTVTISDDDTVGIEARFADGQKYQIASTYPRSTRTSRTG